MTTNQPRVLVVDDEDSIRRITCFTLCTHGYCVCEASTGLDALKQIRSQLLDLIVLDLNLPDMSGVEVLEQLNNEAYPPVIMFSASGCLEQIRLTIAHGAADFLAKPFQATDLLSRVRSVLHASEGLRILADSRYLLGPIDLNLNTGKILIDGVELILTTVEFQLLSTFVQHPGRLLSYQLLKTAIGEPLDSSHGQLITQIHHLRRILEVDPLQPRMLTSETGIGFRFQPECLHDSRISLSAGDSEIVA